MVRMLTVALIIAAVPALAFDGAELTGPVTRVRDGDTIEVGAQAVRLQGLAAPELSERGGYAAAIAMTEIIEAGGGRLRCELDGTVTHDRVVGVCFLPAGEDIAAILVS